MKTLLRELALSALLASSIGCATLGNFVWVDEYKQPPAPGEDGYVIAPGDQLSVRVYNQEAMSARLKVRQDGKASLPFLNDVEMAGEPPTQLAARLQTLLKKFINTPVVTISLEEPAKLSVTVLGEVGKSGVFLVDQGSGVLPMIALAGGLSEFAHKDRIFVLRKTPEQTRIRFTFQALAHADGKASQFRLRDSDIVVVE